VDQNQGCDSGHQEKHLGIVHYWAGNQRPGILLSLERRGGRRKTCNRATSLIIYHHKNETSDHQATKHIFSAALDLLKHY